MRSVLAKELTLCAFWLWLFIMGATWTLGLLQTAYDGGMSPWRLVATALFFACFFLSPLLRAKPVIQTLNLSLAAILIAIGFWPEQAGAVNPYPLLAASILTGHAVLALPHAYASVVGVVIILGVLAPAFADYPALPPFFIAAYAALLAISLVLFRMLWMRVESAEARNEALLDEYRKLKRRVATGEEIARQEERAQVGRDIHDSVGHKLTALMMQLEIFRMRADGEDELQLRRLKELAQESLQETRSAVKALKSSEPGGLSAIIRLIRQLEVESVVRIHFTVKYGAMSAPLTNEQSIAVYRAVQEALTNIMKHSGSGEAEIVFEAPGGSIFRFEISNPTNGIKPFQPGFGLQSMRERIENCKGKLDIISSQHHFIVRVEFPLDRISTKE